MRDLAQRLLEWQAAGAPCAVADIVTVRGSAPPRLGATLCLRADGTTPGSVSGSCVEDAVYDAAREVLDSGQPRGVARLPRKGSRIGRRTAHGLVLPAYSASVADPAPFRRVPADAMPPFGPGRRRQCRRG
ncbi:XdhC family protein [Streptomyces sp. NPDC056323]|uniref:XdhC family protein n=1 Tax=unclassified Streptomyces TaxID=2593676 RepID=UPI0035D7D133